MNAKIFKIEERLKENVGMVRPGDFRFSEVGPIDAQCVMSSPNISLYCLDFENRTGIFVETPPDVDLANVPFLYAAQYEHAQRAVSVPFETLHQLAAESTVDPSRIIFVYSVGRCGSTLVSHAFGTIPGIESLSEPDVHTQMLGTWGAAELLERESLDLIRTCTLLQCAPGMARGANASAMKFRSMVTRMGPALYHTFPEAKVVFLYRNAVPWAKSFLRMLQVQDPVQLLGDWDVKPMFGKGFEIPGLTEHSTMLEMLAKMWASTMGAAEDMRASDIPMFLTRYEDLTKDPKGILRAMFEFCGLERPDEATLDLVLAKDSQEGSAISRMSNSAAPVTLTSEHAKLMNEVLAQLGHSFEVDSVLAGTCLASTPSKT